MRRARYSKKKTKTKRWLEGYLMIFAQTKSKKYKEFTLEKGKRSKLLKKKIQLKQPWGLNLLAMMAYY